MRKASRYVGLLCVLGPEAAPDLELLALAAENRKLQEELQRQQSHVQELQRAYAARLLQNEDLRRQIADNARRAPNQTTAEDARNSHVKDRLNITNGLTTVNL